jgi:hypothetical protein
LDEKKIFRGDCSETVWRQGGNAIKVQMESLVPDFSKITRTKRIEEMVLMHVWLSGIKALPDTNSYFRQGLLLRDKMTIFTSLLALNMSFDT